MKTNNEIFEEIARACPIEVGLELAGLTLKKRPCGPVVSTPKQGGCFLSPLRKEQNPSFTVYRKGGIWFWSDKADRTGGNLITLIAKGRGIGNSEAAQKIDQRLRLGLWKKPGYKKKHKESEFRNIETRGCDAVTANRIATSAGLVGSEGVERLRKDGILHVGDCRLMGPSGLFPVRDCWFLLDTVTKGATARTINGERIGTAKSVTPTNWRKAPIGLGRISSTDSAAFIVEGEKDALALAHALYFDRTPIIAMPSTSTALKGHRFPRHISSVRILAQADRAGVTGAIEWFAWVRTSCEDADVEVWVPNQMGYDWADLFSGMTAIEAAQALELKRGFSAFGPFDSLPPSRFVEAEPCNLAPKAPGSPRNLKRERDIIEARKRLPKDKRDRIAEICRAIGYDPRKRSDTKKVERSLKKLGLR